MSARLFRTINLLLPNIPRSATLELPMTAYDPANIFAKILRGEIPCHKVYEDGDTVAFMDVMPQAKGHALVVPKNASRNFSMPHRPTFAPSWPPHRKWLAR